MACWIRTCIIVNNRGTILLGNANILPIIQNNYSTTATESNNETNIPSGISLDTGASVASSNRRKKRKQTRRPHARL